MQTMFPISTILRQPLRLTIYLVLSSNRAQVFLFDCDGVPTLHIPVFLPSGPGV